MSINKEHLPNWRDLGTLLIFQSDDFTYKQHVLITDFENCLVKPIKASIYSKTYVYGTEYAVTIEYSDKALVQRISDAQTHNLVIITHCFVGGKLVIDRLKHKIEAFAASYCKPIIVLVILSPNRLSKPHTGSWLLLQGYYKKFGKQIIKSVTVISCHGGVNGASDMDRAYAHNIGANFYTIHEFMDPSKKEKFQWNNLVLVPEVRQECLDKLSKYNNPNILDVVARTGIHDIYIIAIYGAPRSGKSTLARFIAAEWKKCEFFCGKKLMIVDTSYGPKRRVNVVKKYMDDYMSILLDGNMHIEAIRKTYEEIAKQKQIPIVYIEVNPSIGVSYLLNHVAVETAKNEEKKLVPINDYIQYKSKQTRPKNVLLYCPVIRPTKQFMDYRY